MNLWLAVVLGLAGCRSAGPTPPPVAPSPAAPLVPAPVIRAAPPAPGPVVEALADVHECSTERLLGLTREILAVYRELEPEGLVALDDPRIGSGDPLGAPLVKPIVRDAILATLNDPKLRRAGRAREFRVTSGWRSVAQQYVLHANCVSNVTALPGESNHADGSAFDLRGAYGIADACLADPANAAALQQGKAGAVRDRAHAFWGKLLEAHGFIWYGSDAAHGICDDPPHFDHRDAPSEAMRRTSTRAFQVLWNRRNPCDPIDESGLISSGDETEQRLIRSPVAGFGDTARLSLPVEGVLGAGCGVGARCCPGDGVPVCRIRCSL